MQTSDGVLSKFSVKGTHNIVLKFHIMVLPDSRFQEFMGFYMKYFVSEETSHKATGLMENAEAFHEYRRVLSKTFDSKNVLKIVCCVDNDVGDSEIVGGSILQLYNKGDRCDYSVEAETEPVRICKTFTKQLGMLVSAEELMRMYKVDRFCEILGTAVRPDVRKLGFLKELVEASYKMCLLHCVTLIGAWCTSIASQKVATNIGWNLIYETNNKDLGQLLGIQIDDNPPTIQFLVQKISHNSKL